MKQWIALLMAVLMVSLAIPAALADDNGSNNNSSTNSSDWEVAANATISATEGFGATWHGNGNNDRNETDNETQNEVKAMDNTHGANMRLLELQREIQRRVLYSNAVISYLQNKSVNQSTIDDLQAISVSLNALVPSIQTAMNDNTTSVQTFLDIKAEAQNLTSQFRTEVRTVLSASDIKGFGDVFKNIDKTQLKAIDDQIKQERQQYNADQVATILSNLGSTATDLSAKVRSGEITPQQARDQLKSLLTQLKPQERQKATQKLQEKEAKEKVAVADKVAKAQENMLDRRAKFANTIASELKAHGFDKASANWDQRSQMLLNRSENIQQRIQGERTFPGGPKNKTNNTPDTGLRVRGLGDNQPNALPEGAQ